MSCKHFFKEFKILMLASLSLTLSPSLPPPSLSLSIYIYIYILEVTCFIKKYFESPEQFSALSCLRRYRNIFLVIDQLKAQILVL